MGTRFPADYKAFMSVYGCGSVNDEAAILRPVTKESQWAGSMTDEPANARYSWETEGGRAALDVDPKDILTRGGNDLRARHPLPADNRQ